MKTNKILLRLLSVVLSVVILGSAFMLPGFAAELETDPTEPTESISETAAEETEAESEETQTEGTQTEETAEAVIDSGIEAYAVGQAGESVSGVSPIKSSVSTTIFGTLTTGMASKGMRTNGTIYPAYCLEDEKFFEGGIPYEWDDLTISQRFTVKAIIAQGYSTTGTISSSDSAAKWLVTQCLIWAAQKKYIVRNTRTSWTWSATVDTDMEKIAQHAVSPSVVRSYYKQLKDDLLYAFVIPSFSGSISDGLNAPLITLKWDGSKYTATVTDTKGVLSRWNYTMSGVTFTKSGNSLTISTQNPITSPTFSNVTTHTIGSDTSVVTWGTAYTAYQTMATKYYKYTDPATSVLKLQTEGMGGVSLKKVYIEAEMAIPLSGAEFSFYKDVNGNGTYEASTDTLYGTLSETGRGVYSLLDIPVGKYLLKETKAPTGYNVDPKYYEVTIEAGKTAQVTNDEHDLYFIETPKSGIVRIVKTAGEDGDTPISGAEFTVYSTIFDASDDPVWANLPPYCEEVCKMTDSGGVYEASLPVGKYFIKETGTPTGYTANTNAYFAKVESEDSVIKIETEAGKGFINTPQKGTLKIIKQSEDGKISGVQFRITGTSLIGRTVDMTVRTGTDGTVTVPNLYVSDNNGYTVTEIGTGIQYNVPPAQSFDIEWNKTTEITFINTFKKGNITLTKVDKEFPTNKLSDAEFNVYKDVNGNGKYEASTDTLYGRLAESPKGIYSVSDVPFGKYLVKETKAPTGFILDTNYYSVSIETNGKTYTVENEAGKGFVNSRQKGTLKIIKQSEDGKISGVQFRITGTSLIGEKVSLEVQTGADGTVTVPSLLVSNNAGYTITEVDTGIQYNVPQAQNFVIDWNKTTEVTFINTFKKGNITLTKVDKEFPTNKLSGAEFTVYKDVNNNGTYEADTDTEYGKLAENKGVYTLSELPYGKYIVKETKAPTGFILDANYYPVFVEIDGKTYTVENEAGKGFVNSRQKGTLKVHKESEDDIIEGVKFNVFGTSLIGETVNITTATDKNGVALFESLLVSDENGYTVTEVDTGIQYVVPQAQTADIEWNKTTELTFINTFKKGTVTLDKVDAEMIYVKLSGAEFTVYNDVNGNGTYEADIDTEYGKLEESQEHKGTYEISEVPYGKYLLQETQAPIGFIRDTNYYPFMVSEDEEVINISNVPEEQINTAGGAEAEQLSANQTFANTPIKGDFMLFKTDRFDGRLLADCDVEILNDKGDVVAVGRTDKDGVLKFEALRYGQYSYREKNAPKGYILDNTAYPFEILENGQIIKVTLPNDKAAQPGTGESPNYPLYIILAASFGGAAGAAIFRRRKNRKRR